MQNHLQRIIPLVCVDKMEISFYRLQLCFVGIFIFGTVCAEDIVHETEYNISETIYERLNDLERKVNYLEGTVQESRGKSY